MSRINSNIGSVIAQDHLRQANQNLQVSLRRLATGLRINTGSDDPAGLIVSEHLRSEISAVTQAINNSQRAINVITTTEGALNEVAALLTDIQGLVVQAANTGAFSEAERQANQLQIDSAIASITRIANTTTFAGRKLLDGSLGFVTSGVATNVITDLNITGATFGTRSRIPVEVTVTQSAQHAQLFFTQGSITSAVTIEISGSKGVTSLSLSANQTMSAVIAAINNESDATGVEAVFINDADPTSGIIIQSVGFGTGEEITIRRISGGSFDLYKAIGDPDTATYDKGQDIQATVNGALTVGRGLNIILNTETLDLSLQFDPATLLSTTTSFEILAGGALFQLGPDVVVNQQASIGVNSVAASRLGNTAVGFLSQIVTGEDFSILSLNDLKRTADIVEEAIRQVSELRGRLGAFERNTLATNINQLTITMENLTASESAIRDTDFAAETAALTRNQILVSASTSVLAIANAQPQQVLQLLGG